MPPWPKEDILFGSLGMIPFFQDEKEDPVFFALYKNFLKCWKNSRKYKTCGTTRRWKRLFEHFEWNVKTEVQFFSENSENIENDV